RRRSTKSTPRWRSWGFIAPASPALRADLPPPQAPPKYPMRLPKPWTKKRGGRLLGGALSGAVGEVSLLAGLFLLGVFASSLMLLQRFASESLGGGVVIPEGIVSDEASSDRLGFWIVMLLAVAMLVVGGGGLLYRLL